MSNLPRSKNGNVNTLSRPAPSKIIRSYKIADDFYAEQEKKSVKIIWGQERPELPATIAHVTVADVVRHLVIKDFKPPYKYEGSEMAALLRENENAEAQAFCINKDGEAEFSPSFWVMKRALSERMKEVIKVWDEGATTEHTEPNKRLWRTIIERMPRSSKTLAYASASAENQTERRKQQYLNDPEFSNHWALVDIIHFVRSFNARALLHKHAARFQSALHEYIPDDFSPKVKYDIIADSFIRITLDDFSTELTKRMPQGATPESPPVLAWSLQLNQSLGSDPSSTLIEADQMLKGVVAEFPVLPENRSGFFGSLFG